MVDVLTVDFHGKAYSLGYFKGKEQAIAARIEARGRIETGTLAA